MVIGQILCNRSSQEHFITFLYEWKKLKEKAWNYTNKAKKEKCNQLKGEVNEVAEKKGNHFKMSEWNLWNADGERKMCRWGKRIAGKKKKS